MRELFLFLVAGGLAWLATIIATLDPKTRKRLYQRIDLKRFTDRLHNDALQKALYDAGFTITAKRFNLFRMLTSLAILAVGYGSSFIYGERTIVPMMLVFFLWFTTSPRPMTLGWFVYNRLRIRRDRHKDRELIALVRLYEQNKRGQNLKLDVFIKRIAPYFQMIRKELILLSERITDDGTEKAMQFFSSLFPGHPFARQVVTIILATEHLPPEEAIVYLEQESHTIAKISSDLYMERWSTLSTIATVVNATPSFTMFFLVIALVLYHIASVKDAIIF